MGLPTPPNTEERPRPTLSRHDPSAQRLSQERPRASYSPYPQAGLSDFARRMHKFSARKGSLQDMSCGEIKRRLEEERAQVSFAT